MAFWGVEVKPGKPFTHTADDARGRLHVSQATLGIGTAIKKSIVQCNVGYKSPVFLCSLFPEKAESCQLNLEFEEADEVVFSVIGPRSVHLTGYFIGRGTHYNLNDESESYGEDIADTETERSTGHSNEDKYEDSFINDDDPEVFPSSLVSDSEEIEETPERRKAKNVKGSHRRLRKKYQLSESDDDVDVQEHMVANGTAAQDSESEDMLPISSLCKVNPPTMTEKLEAEEKVVEKSGDTKPSTENGKSESEETTDKKSYEKSIGDSKDEGHFSSISARTFDVAVNVEPKRPTLDDSKLPSMEAGPENTAKPKKIKKAPSKEGKDRGTNGSNYSNAPKEDKAPQNDTEADKMVPHLPVEEENHETSNYNSKGANVPPDFLLPSTQVGSESDAKPKKRKRKERADEKSIEVDIDQTNLKKDGYTLQDEVKPNCMGQDLPVRNEQIEKEANNKIFDNNIQSAGENQSVEKKKKKKKRRTIKDEKVMDIQTPLQSMDAKSGSVVDTEKISGDNKLSQLETLAGGVVIEELEAGKPDGKVAVSGKKVSVHYAGKLKENGQVFESTVGGTPYKFRLGRKDVIDGFEVGLEGMRVGEKRRILIPPLMGYGNEGDGKIIPPNSSLVYDVELVKVHR